jgi:hypothetical protein
MCNYYYQLCVSVLGPFLYFEIPLEMFYFIRILLYKFAAPFYEKYFSRALPKYIL